MGVSDFKHIYLAGFGLIVAGALTLLVGELLAAWVYKAPGDTITEIMASYHIPWFVYATFAVTLATFIITLALHLWASGKGGL